MTGAAPVVRTYLPASLVIDNWEDIIPFFEELDQRPLGAVDDLHRWLRDMSELEAAISEEGAWRYIRMTLDTRDVPAGERYRAFVADVLPQVEQRTDALQRKLIGVPFLDQLSGDGYTVLLRGIREQLRIFREANVPVQAELRSMAQTYSGMIGAMTVNWEGEQLTMPRAAAVLESPDRSERETMYKLLAERRAEDSAVLDQLFHEMVGKRNTVALNAGFVDFRDYMYSALGRFDHNPADAEAFHRSVEVEVIPVVDRLHRERRAQLGLDVLKPWDLAVDPTGLPPLRPFHTADQLLDLAQRVFANLDPWFAECLATMQQQGKLDLASREGKAPGGYNYPLYESGAPFIFMNAVGTTDDVITMVHEGGHAIHSFLSHPLSLTGFKNFPSEVAELASMSMELLTMDHWHLIYPDPDELKRAKRDQLERVLTILPWVAAIDAFQHAVYTHPTWTVEERTAEWLRVHQRFAGAEVDWNGCEAARAMLWQKQLHLFEVPFYYIEYAIAQLGALGVWRNYKRDPARALADYKAALALGYTRTLPEIYAAAGIRFDLSPAYVRELIDFVNAELDAL